VLQIVRNFLDPKSINVIKLGLKDNAVLKLISMNFDILINEQFKTMLLQKEELLIAFIEARIEKFLSDDYGMVLKSGTIKKMYDEDSIDSEKLNELILLQSSKASNPGNYIGESINQLSFSEFSSVVKSISDKQLRIIVITNYAERTELNESELKDCIVLINFAYVGIRTQSQITLREGSNIDGLLAIMEGKGIIRYERKEISKIVVKIK
jgi:hypothetical protein